MKGFFLCITRFVVYISEEDYLLEKKSGSSMRLVFIVSRSALYFSEFRLFFDGEVVFTGTDFGRYEIICSLYGLDGRIL